MNCFGDKIVFAQIKEGRDQLIALNAALRRALEAAGFDCEDRYIPHVTVMKVRREKAGIKRNKRGIMLLFQTGGNAQAGIPRDAFNQFVDHNFGTQVLHTEHLILHAVTSNFSLKSVHYELLFIQGAYFQEIPGIQLLSMHKPANLEDHYFSEGEFLFNELTGAFKHPTFESSMFLVNNKLFR